MSTMMTAREINGDFARAKRAAEAGPVFVTEHGKVSHVVLTYEEWQSLSQGQPSLLDMLSNDAAAQVPFEPARLVLGLKLAGGE